MVVLLSCDDACRVLRHGHRVTRTRMPYTPVAQSESACGALSCLYGMRLDVPGCFFALRLCRTAEESVGRGRRTAHIRPACAATSSSAIFPRDHATISGGDAVCGAHVFTPSFLLRVTPAGREPQAHKQKTKCEDVGAPLQRRYRTITAHLPTRVRLLLRGSRRTQRNVRLPFESPVPSSCPSTSSHI